MSATYWTENLDDWENILNDNSSSRIMDSCFSWSEVAGADVAGAVGAAVTTAIVNAVPGGGQVAYGSAIVGGAAGGSAADAVFQLWQKIF